MLLDTLPSGSFTTPVLLLKNNGWPVMVYAGGGILKIVSWTGNSWDFQYPPFGYEEENTLLDGKDLLWLGDFTGSGWIDIYHQIAGTDWDTLQLFQDSLVSGGLCVDTSNAPHLIFKKGNNLLSGYPWLERRRHMAIRHRGWCNRSRGFCLLHSEDHDRSARLAPSPLFPLLFRPGLQAQIRFQGCLRLACGVHKR